MAIFRRKGRRAMSRWAERVHRGAVTFSHVVTSCGHPNMPYPRRLDKVKFGVPLDQVCKNDIPGSLLVLILKLNKEAPLKKDVFRAPGHQANMKKLIHFLQAGRLVNIDNFSVYTIASVLKKFLRKLPNGIFGREGEHQLFEMMQLQTLEEQRQVIHSLVKSLEPHAQRLLVLLFGTFRVIAAQAACAQTGMTAEALGVSVAPSFFHTCVSDGRQARMEDVNRFKVATKIMKLMIDNFGVTNLFGRDNYEYYARITGRILKVDDDWIFSFRYPPDVLGSPMSQQEETQSTPALLQVLGFAEDGAGSTTLGAIPENKLLTTESYTRLSTSLEENGLFKGSSRSSCSSANTSVPIGSVGRCAESTKSLSFLPQVHERQAARMRTRSEWFLTPLSLGRYRAAPSLSPNSSQDIPLSASADSVQKRPSFRRGGKNIHRSSSKRNKENGSRKCKKLQTEQDGDKRALKDGANIQTYSPQIYRKCLKMAEDEDESYQLASSHQSSPHFSFHYQPRI